MATRDDLIQNLKGTAETYGRQISEAGALVYLTDLAAFPPEAVLIALKKCRQELKTFPSVADIVARIDDGRPGPEEAWAAIPRDEMASVVWTEEMRLAFGAALPLINEGDMVAARMAFKENYVRLVSQAREMAVPTNWTASLGHDPRQRKVVLSEAVLLGRMSREQAEAICPEIESRPKTAIEAPKMKSIAGGE